ncbi:choice-of-anchor L domain-containing protein [Chitinophagaceae bacterium MMS25-I14]
MNPQYLYLLSPSAGNTRRIAVTLFFCLFFICSSYAQLTVQPSSSAVQLASSLAGRGVTITGATLHCPPGASAVFSSSNTNLGVTEGVLLTTGQAKSLPGQAAGADGPATLVPTSNNGGAGDAQLGSNTVDACILEFDFVPIGDTIRFSYVFASEEYSYFNCTKYNDMFGFYISGPGAAGNMAKVPGTTIPVSINSINNGTPGIDGDILNCTSMGAGSPFTAYYVDNTHGTDITYDGFTVPLVAKCAVHSCETYHLKMTIADVGDANYDSGVFLAAGSLTSNPLSVRVQGGANGKLNTPAPYCIRGCAPGRFVVNRHSTGAYPLTVRYALSGTAQNGVDYTQHNMPGRVTIPAGDSVAYININPLVVNPATGPRIAAVKIFPVCDSVDALDSAQLVIEDSVFSRLLTPDTTICKGDTIQLRTQHDSITTFSWTPATGLVDASQSEPLAVPAVTTTYAFTVDLPGCPARVRSVQITVQDAPSVHIDQPRSLCEWDTLQLDPHIAPPGNYTYQWTPPSTVINPSTAATIYTAQQSGYVGLAVSTSAGCTHKDSVYVTVFPGNFAAVDPADTAVCPGALLTLHLSGAVSWSWSTQQYIVDTAMINPVAAPLADITYNILARDAHGCLDTVQSQIHVLPQAVILLPDSISLAPGESAQLDPRGNCLYFQWFPGAGLSDASISDPVVSPSANTRYYVDGITESGCRTRDSVDVFTDAQEVIDLPNAFSPGAGVNNELKVVHKGIFSLHYFRIFNRWGQKIFETSDINEGWNGRFNGTPQPQGAYVYTFEAFNRGGKRFFKQGNVTLLR